MNTAIDFLTGELIYFWFYCQVQAKQILPFYFAGMAAGSFISVFAKNSINTLTSRTGVQSLGIFGLILAVTAGFISPLCMYGTIPIAASLSRQGVREDFLAAFMMGSILINPQLAVYTLALGETAFLARIISCFACALAAGLLIRYFCKNKRFFNFSSFNNPVNKDTHPNLALRFFYNLCRNFKATFWYVLIGIALAAIFTRTVPADLFSSFFGRSSQFGVFLAATIGVPVYVCGGGTIPLLQEWLWSGMSMGAACAFMLTGPATKITNLSAVKIILGSWAFAVYLIFIMISALISGIITNILIT